MKKKKEKPSTTEVDKDGFLKPTRHFETPKVPTSSQPTKSRVSHKKIQKPRVDEGKSYNSLKYIEMRKGEKGEKEDENKK